MSIKSHEKKKKRKEKAKAKTDISKDIPLMFDVNEYDVTSVKNKINKWKLHPLMKNHSICYAKIFDISQISEFINSKIDSYNEDIGNSIGLQLYYKFQLNLNSVDEINKFEFHTSTDNPLLNKIYKFNSRRKNSINIPINNPNMELPFNKGFMSYPNCLFVGDNQIIHIFIIRDENGVKWIGCNFWFIYKNISTIHVLLYNIKQEEDDLCFNPLDAILIESERIDIKTQISMCMPLIKSIIIWTLINNRNKEYVNEEVKSKKSNSDKDKDVNPSNTDNIITLDLSYIHKINLNQSSPTGIKKKYHEVAEHTRRYKSGKVIQVKSHHRGDISLGEVKKPIRLTI